MNDDRPVTGFDPPIGEPAGDGAEHEMAWNWPFIGVAVALTVVVIAVGVFLATRNDNPPPTTTTTTVPPTTTQLSATSTISELLPLDTQFTTLLELADGSAVVEALAGDEPLTLLAPQEEAWDGIDLPEPGSAAAEALLARHVLEGSFTIQELTELDGSTVTASSGDELGVQLGDDGSITVGGATIVKSPIEASNGTILVVDSVVSP